MGSDILAPQSDLLSENGQLCKKLEAAKAQQRVLDMENSELKVKAATLEKDNHVIMYDLCVAQNTVAIGNINLQSTEQHLKEVKTQASSLADAAQPTAKAFLQAAPESNAVKSQKQYVPCNSTVKDVIQQHHVIMGTKF